jgi:hypothetical protein
VPGLLQEHDEEQRQPVRSIESEKNGSGLTRFGVCKIDGGPGRSRTADQRFRKPLLYPTELRGRQLLMRGVIIACEYSQLR